MEQADEGGIHPRYVFVTLLGPFVGDHERRARRQSGMKRVKVASPLS